MQCEDGDIKPLMEETKGQVEVCISKRWATVSYEGSGYFYDYAWMDSDSAAATVICRQLGYGNGKWARLFLHPPMTHCCCQYFHMHIMLNPQCGFRSVISMALHTFAVTCIYTDIFNYKCVVTCSAIY